MHPQMTLLAAALVAASAASAQADGPIYVVDPPRIWNKTDPVAAEMARSDRMYQIQIGQYRDARNKMLGAMARGLEQPSQPRPPGLGVGNCAALQAAIASDSAAAIRQILSQAPRPGPWPATTTLAAIVRAWQGHCGFGEAGLVTIAKAFGVVVPRPAAKPLKDLTIKALRWPAGPPETLPVPLLSAATARIDGELLGNLVPEGGAPLIQRSPSSGDRPLDKIQIVILPFDGANVRQVEFLREIRYRAGALAEIEDSFYCKTPQGAHDTCQRATYLYKAGKVASVRFGHGAMAGKTALLAGGVLPAYQPGPLVAESNGAPAGALFAAPIPSRYIQRWPQERSADKAAAEKVLAAAYRLPQRKYKQTTAITWATDGPKDVAITLRDGKGRAVFERKVRHRARRVAAIEDAYLCSVGAKGALAEPCGDVQYDYEQDFMVRSRVRVDAHWRERAVAKLPAGPRAKRRSAGADPRAPAAAIFAPAPPAAAVRPGTDQELGEQLTIIGPLARPVEGLTGGPNAGNDAYRPGRGKPVADHWTLSVWVDYRATAHPYHGRKMFHRDVRGARDKPGGRLVLKEVVDRFLCPVPGVKGAIQPCGTITYAYDAGGKRDEGTADVGPGPCDRTPWTGGLSCTCDEAAMTAPNKPVYGSQPYSGSICKAARHAGVLGAEGGDVTIKQVAEPSRSLSIRATCVVIPGSESHGVTSEGLRHASGIKAFVFLGQKPGKCLPWASPRVPL